MVDHKQVYLQEAEQYQRLIAREDYQGNLKPAIQEIVPLDGLDLVDLGSGTGRLVSLFGSAARRMIAFDLSPHMLGTAVDLFGDQLGNRWLAAAADHRAMPLSPNSADVILSGWSFCYLAVWEKERWDSALWEGLKEIKRVIRDQGWVIIVETLGTGVEEPQPPDKLVPYFDFLDGQGFDRTWIRTDYRFNNIVEARELTSFFFGEAMPANLSQEPQPVLPECTGIWSCRVSDLRIWKE